MLNIMDVWIETKWDARRWELALKGDKPIEVYQEMVAAAKESKDTPTIDELPEAERAWLRNS